MNQSLIVGDLLTRPKLLGLVEHYGVWLGFNRVATNTPDMGEHVTSLEDFAAGQRVKVQRTGANPMSVALNAQRVLANPKKYDPVTRNCEHTASEIIRGVPRSGQLLLIAAALLLLVALFRLSRS